MKKISTLLILIVMLSSCVTTTKLIPGATVQQDKSFHSVNTFLIDCELKGGGVMVAEHKYDPKSKKSRLVQSFEYAEKLVNESETILSAIPRAKTNKYGILITKN